MTEEKRTNSLIGRVVAKCAIAACVKKIHNVSLDFTQIDIISGAGKQPVCICKNENSEIISPIISIAHCHGFVVATAVDTDTAKGVGVDIEQIRDWNKETILGFLNPEEDAYCALQKDRYMERVTLFWCLKEAYLKAIGTGIRIHPHSVSIHVSVTDESKISIETKGKIIPAQIFWTREADDCIITSIII